MAHDLAPLAFRHSILDAHPPGAHNDVCLVGDLNGDGKPDVVIGAKYGFNNLVWYENPTWTRHIIATAHLEAGGALADIDGDGRLDIVAGNPMDTLGGYKNTDLFWFANPPDPAKPWKTYLICNRFRKYHDQAVADIDGDGQPEIVFASQGAKVLAYFDIPADPTVQPWPDSCLHIIAEDLLVEGVKTSDIDGDGQLEIVSGHFIFKRLPGGAWRRTSFIDGLDDRACLAVGDLDGDGRPDIVISEGELDRAKLFWLKGPDWKPALLADDLYHPHSLELADFNGDGRLDIYVGEMGLKGWPTPRQIVYRNLGGGEFAPQVVGHFPTHGAKVADLDGDGKPDIVGKPYNCGLDFVSALFNETGN